MAGAAVVGVLFVVFSMCVGVAAAVCSRGWCVSGAVNATPVAPSVMCVSPVYHCLGSGPMLWVGVWCLCGGMWVCVCACTSSGCFPFAGGGLGCTYTLAAVLWRPQIPGPVRAGLHPGPSRVVEQCLLSCCDSWRHKVMSWPLMHVHVTRHSDARTQLTPKQLYIEGLTRLKFDRWLQYADWMFGWAPLRPPPTPMLILSCAQQMLIRDLEWCCLGVRVPVALGGCSTLGWHSVCLPVIVAVRGCASVGGRVVVCHCHGKCHWVGVQHDVDACPGAAWQGDMGHCVHRGNWRCVACVIPVEARVGPCWQCSRRCGYSSGLCAWMCVGHRDCCRGCTAPASVPAAFLVRSSPLPPCLMAWHPIRACVRKRPLLGSSLLLLVCVIGGFVSCIFVAAGTMSLPLARRRCGAACLRCVGRLRSAPRLCVLSSGTASSCRAQTGCVVSLGPSQRLALPRLVSYVAGS